MFNLERSTAWMGLLVCAALAGCAPKTGVSVTGNVPAQYSHVFVTAQAIWFNASATAGPDDTTWIKFPLSTPVTVDLLSATDGTLSQIATSLSVPVGTYAQVRLLPVDSSTALLASAGSLGAVFNSEADFVDSAGTAHQTALELQNPAQGIGIPTTLRIAGDVSGAFASNASATDASALTGATTMNGAITTNGAVTTNGTTTTNGITTTDGTTTTDGLFAPIETTNGPGTTDTNTPGTDTTGTTPGTTGTPATTTTASTTAKPLSLAINLDGSRDLAEFTYSKISGVLLNPHATAYDASTVGAIQGTLTTKGLTGISTANGRLNIQVTAESLSVDGARHVAVNSASVGSDGTFVLYPLSTSSSSAASYDLVIHGPGIATVIVKRVTVNIGDPSSTTPVSIGTIALRTATSYKVNLQTTTPLPAGALVGFYQTLPGSGEVPYLIEERPIDPFNRSFATDQAISAATIDSGTFASGADVTLSGSAAVEGTGTYRVSASAPLFADGVLTTTVAKPAGDGTGTVLVAVPPLDVASGAAADSIALAVTEATAGKYDKGELIVSHDGAVMATAALDTLLAQGGTGTIVVPGIPGGSFSGTFESGLYFVSVRTWNSANPARTLNRQAFATPADLRQGSITRFPVSID